MHLKTIIIILRVQLFCKGVSGIHEHYLCGISCDGQEARNTVSMDWSLALQKLEIRFVADHGAGYPDVLEHLGEKQRLALLKTLGFHVRRRWEIDNSSCGDGSEIHRWVELAGGILVELTDGFVCARMWGLE